MANTVTIPADAYTRLIEAGDKMSEMLDDAQASRDRLLAINAQLRRSNKELTRGLATIEQGLYHEPNQN